MKVMSKTSLAPATATATAPPNTVTEVRVPTTDTPTTENSNNDNKHYKSRYHELKRQLEELEEYNEGLAVKLYRSQKRLRRLKIERNVLLERFEYSKRYTRNSSADDSETGSDSDAPLRNAVPKKSMYAGSVSRSRKRKQHPPLSSSTASTPRMTLSASSSTNTGSRTSGRSKADKDPNAPKRPANAYVMYCMEERNNIKSASSTELTSGELTKMMSDNWRNMEKEKKQMYFDTYVREMNRYQREMEEYNAGVKPTANGETDKKEETAANGIRAMTISPPATAPTTGNNDVQK